VKTVCVIPRRPFTERKFRRGRGRPRKSPARHEATGRGE
jgi:hypothetical protein